MKQMNEEQAISFAEKGLWKPLSFKRRAELQISKDLLCMPFEVFQEAVGEVLKRPVWTHEFAFRESLKKEIFGEKEPPTLEEIINLLPQDKRVVLTK